MKGNVFAKKVFVSWMRKASLCKVLKTWIGIKTYHQGLDKIAKVVVRNTIKRKYKLEELFNECCRR